MMMPFMTSLKDNENILIVVLGEESDGDGYGFLVAVTSHAIPHLHTSGILNGVEPRGTKHQPRKGSYGKTGQVSKCSVSIMR